MRQRQDAGPDTRAIAQIAICVAMLCISAYIAIPLPFTAAKLTAQTLAVNLIALILPPGHTVWVMGSYILLGLCGSPVFSGMESGPGKLFGPTGGFIIAFLLAAPLISLCRGKGNDLRRYLLCTACIGLPVIYLLGALQMSLVMGLGLRAALLSAVVPFIPGDLAKCAVASTMAVRLNKRLAGQVL